MQENVYISKKQFYITVSFALMLLCTTGSLKVFLSSCVQFVLFALINLLAIRYIKNHRICWGIFALSAAVIGEIATLLSQFLSFPVPMPTFFLLPESTFLYLSVPLFYYMLESGETGIDSGYGKGFLFYIWDGVLISLIREVVGFDSFFGKKLGIFENRDVQILTHSSGATTLVILSILLIATLKRNDSGKNWIMGWNNYEEKKYQGMSFSREKTFFRLMLCMLATDVVAGGISVVYLLYAPEILRQPGHVVLYATLLTFALFTLMIKAFKLEDEVDESPFLPLISIVKVSLPLVFYLRRFELSNSMAVTTFVVWWVALVIGVWFSFTVVLFYLHVLDRRLMFCKIPRCLQGIPFIILHILLAQLILMPLLDVISNV